MKKNKMLKTLLQAGLALSLFVGATLPVVATLPVAAETVQVKTYELTAEEKAGIEEYIHARLRVDMQEFYEIALKAMWDTALGTAAEVWEEGDPDIESGLTPEQLAVFKDVNQTLINSIATHYHFLWETRTVAGRFGLQEAKDIVAKYEAEEDVELAPEVELAALKYTKELILETLAKNKEALADYGKYATEQGEAFKNYLQQETIDVDQLKAQATSYGQALATASQPEFPYDFTELDQRIEELKRQLEPKNQNQEGTGNVTPTPPPTPGNPDGSGSGETNQTDGTGETGPSKGSDTDKQVKILPKTSSNQGLLVSIWGLLVASLGMLILAKRKTARK